MIKRFLTAGIALFVFFGTKAPAQYVTPSMKPVIREKPVANALGWSNFGAAQSGFETYYYSLANVDLWPVIPIGFANLHPDR